MAALALVAVAVALLFVLLKAVVNDPKNHADFTSFYVAGAIVHQGRGRSLWDMKLQQDIERPLRPWAQFLPYFHPPFEALLFAPLASLPYPRAFLVWDGLNLAVLALFFYLLRFTGYRLTPDGRLVCLAACFFPIVGNLELGQDSLLMLPIFLLAFLALKQRREVAAGVVLGLGMFRFEILLPFLFIFLLRRRWKLLASCAAVCVAELLVSAAVVGWSGLAQYAKLLRILGHMTGSLAYGVDVTSMPSLRGFAATFLGPGVAVSVVFPLVAAGSLALLGWGAWQFKNLSTPEGPAFDLEFCLAVIMALLASYHLHFYSVVPVIPVFFLALGYDLASRPARPFLRRPVVALLGVFFLLILSRVLFGAPDFSLLFFVLLGFGVWLSREISSLQGSAQAA